MNRLNVSPYHQIAYSKINYKQAKELFVQLQKSNLSLSHLSKIKNPQRKIEWMTVRKMLLELHPESGDVCYDQHGKPHFLTGNDYLSISHSHEMVAISVNRKKSTGIDIQLISDKVIRIKGKFLSEAEQLIAGNDALELCCYWSCKEALFKVYGKKDGFLKSNFIIDQLNFNQHSGSASGLIQIHGNTSEHRLKLIRIENYIMAYVVNS